MIAVTSSEYALMRRHFGGSTARKAIKLGNKMEGVVEVTKFGKSHQIWVSDEFYQKNKKYLKKGV